MPGSAGLGAYLFCARAYRARTLPSGLTAAQPGGVWLIVDTRAALAGALELAARLRRLARRPHVLVTVRARWLDPAVGDIPVVPDGVAMQPHPGDRPGDIETILTAIRPRAVVVLGAQLHPALLGMARDARAFVVLVTASAPALPGHWRLWPGLLRQSARLPDRVLVARERDQAAWARVAHSPDQVEVIGTLSATPGALPCNDAERQMLSDQLRLRPVWLAAGVPESEEAAVINAHGTALRLSHRLVLLLHPADPSRGPALRDALRPRFQVALRSQDDPLTPETQVYVVDTEGERGLWYRLATVCHMGGTLGAAGSTLDPLEPAALGAAIVHGSYPGRHRASYRRLQNHRASRLVPGPGALGEAVSALLEPARAAEMAAAAWEVTSEGAGATERLVDILRTEIAKPQRAVVEKRQGAQNAGSAQAPEPAARIAEDDPAVGARARNDGSGEATPPQNATDVPGNGAP